LKYCTEEAGKEAFACARTPCLRLRSASEDAHRGRLVALLVSSSLSRDHRQTYK